MESNGEIEKILTRSLALAHAGRDEENRHLLRAAVDRFPDSAQLNLRAAIEFIDVSPNESEHFLRRAAKLGWDDAGVLLRCAYIMFDLGKFADTKAWLGRVQDIASASFPLLPEVAHLTGQLLLSEGRTDDALAALEVAFAEEPDIDYGRTLAQLYITLGRTEDALETLNMGLEHGARDPWFRHTRRMLSGSD